MIASDVFGDQESLIVGFRQEGQAAEHALVVLVNHNLSGHTTGQSPRPGQAEGHRGTEPNVPEASADRANV